MYRIIGGDRKEYGPVSGDDLRRWLAEGRLNAQSQAQAEGTAEWKPLTAFSEFADALRAQAGSAPSPGAPPPLSGAAWGQQILTREAGLRLGRCFSGSLRLLFGNFGLVLGASSIVWAASLLQLVPLADLVYKVLWGAVYGGFYVLLLKRIRGQSTALTEVFGGFKSGFGQLVLAGFISSLLGGIGFLFCILPGIYLTVAWVFCVPLVADKGLEFWPAMELSRKVVSRVWFQVFGLLLVAFLPMVIVSLVVIVKMMLMVVPVVQHIVTSWPADPARVKEMVLPIQQAALELGWLARVVFLFNLPFGAGALMHAYEDLFGTRPAQTA